jgi:predicted acylesterase/phospholipase RssA
MATGLVLTGGGLRGICAQTGALVALERRGYRFDAIIGTSAGAIVGALYASHGPGSAEAIADRLRSIRREDYLDELNIAELLFKKEVLNVPITGLHSGAPLLAWLRDNLGQECIEKCEPPLFLSVTNISRSFPQIKTEGPLAEFARASSAVPGFFEAQEVEGEVYVDGGVANNVPVDELAKRREDLDQFLVLTSLGAPQEPEPDNDFLNDNFPLLAVLERSLRAAGEGLALNNLSAGERRVEVLRVQAPDIDLEDAARVGETIDAAIANAERQIAEAAIDLTGIRREG